MFQVGDKVQWSSTSAGSRTTKRGEIVFLVPKDTLVPSKLPEPYLPNSSAGYGFPRDHDSYLVKVEGKGNRLYWPRVSALTRLS